ncbi:hypothetical protein [Halobacteriovorax sp. CON-3]|uniref:hypothetical protein n=1 Tax=Halobacteriovorax sp. CON-3 TaxID=3157710 RepID=UPI0037142674
MIISSNISFNSVSAFSKASVKLQKKNKDNCSFPEAPDTVTYSMDEIKNCFDFLCAWYVSELIYDAKNDSGNPYADYDLEAFERKAKDFYGEWEIVSIIHECAYLGFVPAPAVAYI